MTLGDFSAQAQAYAAARPGYPDDLIDDLIDDAGVAHGDTVADLGAGTGILTRQLSDWGLNVNAVEPNDKMRALAKPMPGVTWVNGTFEALPLPDGSQAWCVAAQAFHWADPPRALPEIGRVLRPDGVLSCLWNNRVVTPDTVMARVHGLIAQHVPEFDEAYRDLDTEALLTSTGDFRPHRAYEARHTVAMPRDRFMNLWRSHNRLNHTAGGTRMPGLLQAIETLMSDEAVDTVEVEYTCRAWSVRKV